MQRTGIELKVIGSVGKEVALHSTHEQELFRHRGPGCLNHMWFGGAFAEYGRTKLRVYVDDEPHAGIAMELFPGHGIGFNDDHAPWGSARIGKTGSPSGLFNTYRIPFHEGIRVTAQAADGVTSKAIFWWIIRGLEHCPLKFNGVQLPENARLRLHKKEDVRVEPLDCFELGRGKGAGMLYQVMISAQSTNFSFLEAVLRAYLDGSDVPFSLSSGLEDYFLGTYYFNRGLYHLPMAGLTHLNAADHSFSAYRFHEEDPVFFRNGLRLVCRCGEEANGKVYGPEPPAATTYTTYTWLYEW